MIAANNLTMPIFGELAVSSKKGKAGIETTIKFTARLTQTQARKLVDLQMTQQNLSVTLTEHQAMMGDANPEE